MTKPITRKMAVDCLLWLIQEFEERRDKIPFTGLGNVVFCPECFKPIKAGESIQFDHRHAIIHDGPHDYQNLRPIHTDCHKAKTARDIAANAKVKRLRGETCNGPKKQIQSRGFDKTKSKGFDGRVRERT